MPLQGKISEFHLPVNNYVLSVASVPPPPGLLTFTKISGLETEVESVELPDRTRVSGGQTKALTFTADMPMHHILEQLYMEQWFDSGREPVKRGYKRDGTLLYIPIGLNPVARGGGVPRTIGLKGMFVTKRKYPDLDMKNEGDMAVVEYTISVDEVFPL